MSELGNDESLGGGAERAADNWRDRAVSPFIRLSERFKSPRAKSEEAVAVGMNALVRTIEGEIIPRLLLVHQSGRGLLGAPGGFEELSPTEEERTRFLWTVMNGSADACRSFVATLIDRGVPREAIFLDLLSGAARRLGDLWDEDLCDFTDVTIGLCRLHQVLREQCSQYENELTVSQEAPSVLLTTAVGEQHVFGVVMVAEFFRREGWSVWCDPATSLEDLRTLVAREWFDPIGISASTGVLAATIAEEIAALKLSSRNKNVSVIVGGRLFSEDPDLARKVGADATTADPRLAASLGAQLIAGSGAASKSGRLRYRES